MNYIENVFACLAAPLVVALFCVHRFRRRSIAFILIGMLACLASSYINTFLAGTIGADSLDTALEISPMIEEILKLAPIAFYLMVFEPKDRNAAAGEAIMIAVGFATLENACYLISSGADNTPADPRLRHRRHARGMRRRYSAGPAGRMGAVVFSGDRHPRRTVPCHHQPRDI